LASLERVQEEDGKCATFVALWWYSFVTYIRLIFVAHLPHHWSLLEGMETYFWMAACKMMHPSKLCVELEYYELLATDVSFLNTFYLLKTWYKCKIISKIKNVPQIDDIQSK
jgi:hypothetical protein